MPLSDFAPGTYTQRLLTEGNSLLSSLFVEQIDLGATVQVNYYDYGVGTEVGERYNLASHNIVNASATSPDRLLVTKLHNKPVIEIIVTGGNARLGVYLTVVASFASDLDSALKKDGQIADLLNDKGIPVVTYDPVTGKFYMLRSDGGVPLPSNEAGDLVHLSSSDATTPGVAQILITDIVPSGKVRKMSQVIVVCRSHGRYVVMSDGDIIGSGRTGPATPKSIFPWNPRKVEATGKLLTVTFTADADAPVSSVEAYLMASDV